MNIPRKRPVFGLIGQRRVQGFFYWGQNRRADGRVLGRAATPHMRSAVSSPSGVRGGDPTAQRFSTIFSIQDGLSSYYNIVDSHAAIEWQDPRAVHPCVHPWWNKPTVSINVVAMRQARLMSGLVTVTHICSAPPESSRGSSSPVSDR